MQKRKIFQLVPRKRSKSALLLPDIKKKFGNKTKYPGAVKNGFYSERFNVEHYFPQIITLPESLHHISKLLSLTQIVSHESGF